ncbi:acyl-CoA dehydrogenase family protein [Actinomadura madurae]|uniref:acyl-CoA dehydrogenase family protein n=1 Tax=Actinomadura madurae TaxID=1993 RepID=UPI0020D2189D|nr:acyl-CoA dehydrogenase family protein [Actinomadura madurae]MCP9955717.1 acyl-CoA/acyl-ACP dehydrogenase [Actinomadura madurae]MCP9972448.1 acyl-CoA/acyl-ACP dehydrogenase [Actinomadura madurae]MCP9984960.1 acyl-CoA/acyl-ACP dehydrogenase [Actinomadura madurae]MCQ0003479.1 acyl-CoA/acyl-ACP dehydrogenase [Actinomadura madurae]MCQ0021159.1 acyl-CoA/acyl-ACP dehydrogenase [Actinomadura madurae]
MTTRDRDGLRAELRQLIDTICADFPDAYWREVDAARRYPEEFVSALTKTGCLGALVPEEYGGLGLGLGDASVLLEGINANGGNAGPVHAQLYTMGSLLRHGSAEQKERYLPHIASGALRLQAFGITEPTAGTDTTALRTTAVRTDDGYVINGQKVFISRVQHSDLMLLLARTSKRSEVRRRSDGMSLFLIDLRDIDGVEVRPIQTMVNHETNEVYLTEVHVPADALIGEEGAGFRYVLDGMNAERILIASECVGDGRWFVRRASKYATEREVFGRPIGQNQGVQFPIARAHVHVEAADLMRWRAADLFDAGEPCGAEANMAKMLAADASWEAADVALQTHGGYGVATEYDIERKFRETRLYQIAPISTNLILSYVGEHVLGMPRSF